MTDLEALRAEVKASRALIRALHGIGAVGALGATGRDLHEKWVDASADVAICEARQRAETTQGTAVTDARAGDVVAIRL